MRPPHEVAAAVRDGRFRTDLYHRLRVLPLRVPPLRERAADLPVLIRQLIADAAARRGRRPPAITRDALEALTAYNWPGNVRELEHVLERVLVAIDGASITAADLPEGIMSPERIVDGDVQGRPTLEELERRYIAVVLKDTRNNQSRAAEILAEKQRIQELKRRTQGAAPTRSARV